MFLSAKTDVFALFSFPCSGNSSSLRAPDVTLHYQGKFPAVPCGSKLSLNQSPVNLLQVLYTNEPYLLELLQEAQLVTKAALDEVKHKKKSQ